MSATVATGAGSRQADASEIVDYEEDRDLIATNGIPASPAPSALPVIGMMSLNGCSNKDDSMDGSKNDRGYGSAMEEDGGDVCESASDEEGSDEECDMIEGSEASPAGLNDEDR